MIKKILKAVFNERIEKLEERILALETKQQPIKSIGKIKFTSSPDVIAEFHKLFFPVNNRDIGKALKRIGKKFLGNNFHNKVLGSEHHFCIHLACAFPTIFKELLDEMAKERETPKQKGEVQ